jgi:hypothetical protein
VHIRSLLLVVVAACGSGGDDPEPALFPASYATTYTAARPCQPSTDHDLHHIRILVSADAATPYADRTTAFPAGAILVKEEYARTDDTCAGPIVELTAMKRLAAGASPALLDWSWQRTKPDFEPIAIEDGNCSGCHAQCPGGYAGTCAPP